MWSRRGSAMLSVNITKKRRDFSVKISFDLVRGAALGLFGASGSGKSTILSCIAGIEEPDEGNVRLHGLALFPPSLPLHKRPVGYLTQEPNLFPHLSVRDNVFFGVIKSASNGKVPTQVSAWIDELRDRLELGTLWDAPASRIS